jgi:hypothetical protein
MTAFLVISQLSMLIESSACCSPFAWDSEEILGEDMTWFGKLLPGCMKWGMFCSHCCTRKRKKFSEWLASSGGLYVANASRKVRLDECSENSHLHWASEVFKLTHDIHALEHKKKEMRVLRERGWIAKDTASRWSSGRLSMSRRLVWPRSTATVETLKRMYVNRKFIIKYVKNIYNKRVDYCHDSSSDETLPRLLRGQLEKTIFPVKNWFDLHVWIPTHSYTLINGVFPKKNPVTNRFMSL